MQLISRSPADTSALAGQIITLLKPNEVKATVLFLTGDLGTGKTTFTQSLAKELGIDLPVTSPTFVIQKTYETGHTDWQKLMHIDCYRLEGGADLAKLGFSEWLASPETLMVLEWPERVTDILPPPDLELRFKFIDNQTREINYDQKVGH
ncbi:MAG: tRNA (adenosine(37)-N6)-threonylcarbamoyltransferase complex ATPase subunit type 1 TsaE [Candidatus Vogelbacteria bacterium]|nr:tRNA (adenosine(37)-N6)-threonylcarbamoyltransferase complex ATPase subunit type 1 TsaE [Candidatus Vogelbacteria bacterium]